MRWAENIAMNQTADGAWSDWLGSSGHLANIQAGGAGEFGVGAAQSSNGDWWFVMDFGHY
jgi:uncharacterized protein YkwD